MEKIKILVCDGMDSKVFNNLKNIEEFEVLGKSKNSAEEISSLKKEAQALVIRSATKPNKEFIDECSKLKYIIRAGEGTDNIDKAYCHETGVKVSNTPGANNNSAAEHAIALMMTVLRKTAWANESMQTIQWNKSAYTGNELSNKKVGIIGFGRIGQLVAKRLSGFDPEITFFDPYFKSHDLAYSNISQVDKLEDIFSNCDIITVHVPLNHATKGLIDKKYFSLMSPKSIFINAARGGIVNEEDLAEALRASSFRGAGLDVFASEPLKEKSAVHGLDNLVLTPHLGGSTEEAQERVGQMALDQLKAFFLEDKLLHEVR